MLNINTATRIELINEYEQMAELWSMYSCDCFGFYISALHKQIVNLGGFK